MPLEDSGRPASKARWRSDVSSLSGFAAAGALALLLLGSFLLVLNLERMAQTRRMVDVTVGILETARSVGMDVVNAETGQRGYLLTGEERYLQPYHEASGRVWSTLEDAKRRVMVPEQ